MIAGLRKLAAHPIVGRIDGVGLIARLELVADKATRRVTPRPSCRSDRGSAGKALCITAISTNQLHTAKNRKSN
jgi:hypothetical protein